MKERKEYHSLQQWYHESTVSLEPVISFMNSSLVLTVFIVLKWNVSCTSRPRLYITCTFLGACLCCDTLTSFVNIRQIQLNWKWQKNSLLRMFSHRQLFHFLSTFLFCFVLLKYTLICTKQATDRKEQERSQAESDKMLWFFFLFFPSVQCSVFVQSHTPSCLALSVKLETKRFSTLMTCFSVNGNK